MKQKINLWVVVILGLVLLVAFLGGLLWSIFPMAGNTLPHLVAAWCGAEFIWSALLVSVVLGLLCTTGFVLFATLRGPDPQDGSDRMKG